MVINLSTALEKDKKNILYIFQTLQKSQSIIEKKLNQIIGNQDFIKNQSSSSTSQIKLLQAEIEKLKYEISSIKAIVTKLKYL